MLKAYAAGFGEFLTFLVDTEHVLLHQLALGNNQTVPADVQQRVTQCLDLAELHSRGLGLDAGYEKIGRIRAAMAHKARTALELRQLLTDLRERIQDQAKNRRFMYVVPERAEYYDRKELFGLDVYANFNSALYDIQEAGNCYALSRYTACVMHLMRALEVALDAIGLGAGVPNTVIEAKNSWETLLKKIAKQVEVNDTSGDPAWPPKRRFFVDAQAHLYAVKNAWRNPSMHLEKKYDEKEAIRILNAVKGFMEHLATHLNESGHFIP